MIPLQETFDTVVAHLRNQNGKAEISDKDGNLSCQYLTPDGKTCAAGCLIRPEDYNKDFEGKAVTNILGSPTIVGNLLFGYGHDLKLVRRLQNCHDNYDVSVWETYFQNIAKDFKLTYVPKTN